MAYILIVDDDPTVRMIATELLRMDDHAVVEAEDGAQALELIERLPFDLVILDMLMPNVDGLETILEMKRRTSKPKILAISSGGSSEPGLLLRTALVFGADETLSKPLRLASLKDAVNRLLAMIETGAQAQPATTVLSATR